MNIGNQIRSFRLEKNATQEEMASFLGVSPQAVSKWETGASTPDVALLPEIAVYFGIAIDELFAIPYEEQLSRIRNMGWRMRRIPHETFERSLRLLNERIAVNPEDASAYEGLACLYNSRARSDHKDASEYAKRVMELDPERKAGLVELLEATGGACGDEWYDNHFEVIQFLKGYLERHPKNGLALRAIVTNLLDDRRYEEALPYIHALQAVKDGPNIQIYLGDVELGRGKRKEAERLWNEAVEKYPDVWQAYCFRADRLKLLGLFREACADYEKCVKMQQAPHILDGLYSLAQLHETAGDYGAAVRDCERIIKYLETDYNTMDGESVDSLRREIERLRAEEKSKA